MRKLFAMLLLAGSAAWSQGFTQVYGLPLGTGVTFGLQSQSTAATWMAAGWLPNAACTVNKVRFYASAITGTMATTGNFSLKICPDSSGTPGTCASPLQTSTTVTAVPGASGGWVEWTGFTQALTAFTQYWFVAANLTGTPGSNFPTYRFLNGAMFFVPGGGLIGQLVKTSINSGSAWTTQSGTAGTIRVECAGPTYLGIPFQNIGVTATDNERIYSTHEFGSLFTTPWPSTVSLVLKAVATRVQKVSAPTGNLQIKIYSSSGGTETPVATSSLIIPPANVETALRDMSFNFTPSISLAGQTAYRIVVSESAQSDANTEYYTVNGITTDTDANSLPLLPFGGTLRGQYCLGTCGTTSNWVSTNNFPVFAMQLDPAGEITSSGAVTRSYASQ